ncbi:MAG TPA: hypothetical protein VGH27_29070 [Streptosporangiaceae bacterium]|jgi:hypothetical protein
MLTGGAAQVQDRFRARVLAGDLRLDTTWGQPCRSYNVYLDLPAAAIQDLSAAQDRVLAAEPSLIRVPRHALHSNLAWLLSVYLDLPPAGKDRRWQQHGAGWLSVVAAELASLAPRCRLRYRDVVATDSAVIALAWPAEPVNELRARLAERLDLGRPVSGGDLVHTTLFRYREPLADPAALLRELAGLDLDINADVTHVQLVKEKIFPNLEFEVLGRLSLTPQGQQPGQGQRA